MQGMILDALGIIGACLLVAVVATVLVVFRPSARRRRRRKRHSRRPRIDLFEPSKKGAAPEPDA